MGRLLLAIRSFLAIIFRGQLPDHLALALGLVKKTPQPSAAPAPVAGAREGALQMLAILQRDSRFVDFLMEDISGYSDEQVGAAVRGLHEQCAGALSRYLRLAPVIDGVEGVFTKLESVDPARVRLLGNVPADGRVAGGLLRHKGWRAEEVTLPPLDLRQDVSILAPAEIEVE